MIFQRSLVRELTSVTFAVFFVLLAIMLTTQVVRLFDKAAAGDLATDAIFAMIAFTALASFGTLLSITVFVAVLVVLTRIYRDHEMVVWLAAGVSPTQWIRPVLMFAVPITVIIASVTLWIAPWAHKKGNEYADLLKQREEVSALAPGIFKESKSADRVYFVENFSSENGSAQNIFVESWENGVLSTILARRGYLHTTEQGERYLILEDGRRYDGQPGQANYRLVEFERYQVKIDQSLRQPNATAAKQRTTPELWQRNQSDDRAELAWRISMPIATLILALLAIPLAYYNPRSGHTFNLLIALLIYQLYYQSMNVAQKWIGSGKLESAFAILPLHIVMLALFVLLLTLRRKPLRLLRRQLQSRSLS